MASGWPEDNSHEIVCERVQRLASWSLQLLTEFATAQHAAAAESGAQAGPAHDEAEAERAALFAAAFELLLYLAELLDHVSSNTVLEVRPHPSISAVPHLHLYGLLFTTASRSVSAPVHQPPPPLPFCEQWPE